MFSDFLLSFPHITEIFTIVNLTKPSVLSRHVIKYFTIYVHKINFGIMHADFEIEAEVISLKDWRFLEMDFVWFLTRKFSNQKYFYILY
jgi:hypothetical protein